MVERPDVASTDGGNTAREEFSAPFDCNTANLTNGDWFFDSDFYVNIAGRCRDSIECDKSTIVPKSAPRLKIFVHFTGSKNGSKLVSYIIVIFRLNVGRCFCLLIFS